MKTASMSRKCTTGRVKTRYSKAKANGNVSDAEDLTQETYTRFSERVGKQGPLEDDRPEKPYLLTIAKHAQSNQRRKKKIQVTMLQNEAEEVSYGQDRETSRGAGKTAYEAYAAATRRSTYLDRLKDLVPIIRSQLTLDEWQLILLRSVEEMTFDQIAELVGQPRDQVAYRFTKATAKARYWATKLWSATIE